MLVAHEGLVEEEKGLEISGRMDLERSWSVCVANARGGRRYAQ